MPKLFFPTLLIHHRLVLGAILLFALVDFSVRLLFPGEMTICNQGIAWGMPLPFPLVLIGSFMILLSIAFFWWQEKQEKKRIGWVLVFVGGSMNTLERILHGCVTDYLSLPLFPSFNGADMMLTLGVGILILLLIRHRD